MKKDRAKKTHHQAKTRNASNAKSDRNKKDWQSWTGKHNKPAHRGNDKALKIYQ